jgi:hypothetical protein
LTGMPPMVGLRSVSAGTRSRYIMAVPPMSPEGRKGSEEKEKV